MGVIFRAALAYLFLLLVLRLSSRRVMRTATPLDMVLIFVFGGVGVQAVMQDEKSVTAAVLATTTFGLMHLMVYAAKVRWPRVAALSEGTPVVIFEDGEWKEDRLRRAHLDRRDVLAEARQNNIKSLDEVALVVVEHTGGISIVPKPSQDSE